MPVPPGRSTFDDTARRLENLADALTLAHKTAILIGYSGAGDELRVVTTGSSRI